MGERSGRCRLKIGISCYPTFGGSGVVASELGMALADRGHEVHFISYAIPGRLSVFRSGIHYHKVSVPEYPLFEYPPYSLALASHLSEASKRYKLDLIHAHYAIPHAASALLARDMTGGKLKVATTLHGTDVTLVGRDPSFMPITKHAIESSDAVSAVSVFLRDEVCCVLTCDKHIEVIYNFINPDYYRNLKYSHLRKLFAPNGEKLLVHVSNMRPIKRVQDVMEIFLKLRKRLKPPLKLLLVGQGPELPNLEKIAYKNDIEKDVIFLGNRETTAEIIAASDLFLLPSQTESFGLAALEAMASGTPPITTNVGGLPEVIRDAETGFLCDIGDLETMTERACGLLTDGGLYKKMAKAGKEWAFDRFDIGKVIREYEGFYEGVWS